MYITQCEGCETGESDGVLPKEAYTTVRVPVVLRLHCIYHSCAEINNWKRFHEVPNVCRGVARSRCSGKCFVSYCFSMYFSRSWIVSTPHSVPVYTSCT